MIDVLFFGPVVERIGCHALKIEHRPDLTLQDLRDELAAQYPDAFEIVCLAAIDGNHARDYTQRLHDGSEVTFMARFSGG